jgi:hypothetical protein
MAVVAIPITGAAPAQAIWVEPADSGSQNLSDSFTVDIMINVTDPDDGGPLTGLFGWEYKLQWNNTMLDVTSIVTHGDGSPGADLLAGHASVFVATNATADIGGGLDQHWYAVSALSGTGFTGVASLCTYTFQVKYQPAFPASDYVGSLALQDDKLVDDGANLLAHTTGDGAYTVPAVVPPNPSLKIEPAYVAGELGTQFNITIEIENLFTAFDLCGWEAKIGYNTTVLDATNSFEGPFLPGFEGPNGTYYVNLINDTLGIIHTAGLFLGNHTTPSGSGVLAYLQFNATYEFEVPTEGAPPFLFPIDLYDTKLSSCATTDINHTVTQESVYEAPYKSLGWAIDCWTDPFRKKCFTPFTGVGPNMTADAYEPHDMVILYSKLTFNEWPQQNWLISFEIYGPANPYMNFTIFRTAVTNASGVATINFTIPWPCDNPYEIIFGKWTCIQYAQVKDPWAGEGEDYSARPFDILMWDVGWIIELLDVVVDPDPVAICETLNVTVYMKNIMQIEKCAVITLTIYDTLLDPIGSVVDWYCVPPGEYCNPYFDSFVLQIHIPKWAHVGPGAQVFVNAFTALPTDGGCIYCPEVSATFTIAIP